MNRNYNLVAAEEYDLAVLIGKFNPFHVEHKRIVDIALEKSKKVLLLVGSAGNSRSPYHLFTYDERCHMIWASYPTETKLILAPLYDIKYNDTLWTKQVQDVVKKVALQIANPDGFQANGTADLKIALIGASKDHTSFYLKLFPQFDSIDVPIINEIHATDIRDMYLSGKLQRYNSEDVLLPHGTAEYMFSNNGFKATPHYENMQKWNEFVKEYGTPWKVRARPNYEHLVEAVKACKTDDQIENILRSIEGVPYPVKQVTVDAVVEQSGHILMVKRKAHPGMGQWALPGGHLEVNEKIIDGVIRELREETGLKVPTPVLMGSIVNKEVFDDVHRSTLGRVITHAYHFKLADDVKLPKVKGMDDAEKAEWIAIGDIKENMCFDDHFSMLQYFTGQ